MLLCLCAALPAAAQSRLRSPFSVAYDELWLRELPWSSDATSILETVDATAVSDRFSLAGLSAGEPARLGIHAASWAELRYRLDDFDVTDPARPGRPLVLVPRAVLGSARLDNAALGPESDAAGALLSLGVLEPAERWRGRIGYLGAPSFLQTDVSADSAPAIAQLREGFELHALATGPLAKERLRGSFALEWERADRSERGSDARLRGERKHAFAELVFSPSPKQEGRLLLAGHDALGAYPDSALFAGLAWLRRADAGGQLRAAFSYAHRSADPPADARGTLSIERLADGPVADSVPEPGRARVLRGELSFAARALRAGPLGHAASATAQLESSRLSPDATPALLVAELVDGRPARVWSWSAAASSSRSLARLGFAVKDRISVPDRLDASVGLRLDLQNGSHSGGSSVVSWSDLDPHVSLLARPLRSRPLVVQGGFAQYGARLSLPLLGVGDPAARSADVFRWTDANRDALFQPAERGVLVARSGPGGGVTTVDPELKAPRTTEFTAGLVFDRGPLRFSFAGIHRSTRGIPESVNVGAPPASYRVRFLPDTGVDLVGAQDDQLLAVYDRDPASFGRDRYVLSNPEGHDVTHEGVETALELSKQGLRLRLSGTASKTTGAGANRGFRATENDPGLPGELFDNPNADSFASGRMFFDRAYTLKLAGVLRRGAWGAGFAARYSDGQPFARVVIAEGLAQGPEAVAAVSRGDHRFTYILTVDARLARDFTLGRARATASVEAFSLMRQRKEVEEYVVSGPDFRRVTATQPPRALRLGLAVAF